MNAPGPEDFFDEAQVVVRAPHSAPLRVLWCYVVGWLLARLGAEGWPMERWARVLLYGGADMDESVGQRASWRRRVRS